MTGNFLAQVARRVLVSLNKIENAREGSSYGENKILELLYLWYL